MARSHRRYGSSFGAALGALFAVASSGCGESPGGTATDQQALSVPNQARPFDVGSAIAAKERHSDELLAIPGVVGAAVGVTEKGQPTVKVFTEREGVPALPQVLDGVLVTVEVTGEIVALRGPPVDVEVRKGGFSTTSVLQRPVPIGVSTGNAGSCSAGTISARVKQETNGTTVYYALSNNHVYALENTASIPSYVLQPGLYDTSCVFDPDDVIGTLSTISDYEPIVFSTSASNTIDAAIAVASTVDLGNSTPRNGYGTPSSGMVGAYLGQPVQKYGRSTSLTTGTVTAIDATVNVGYDHGTARFVDQIFVQSSRPFIKAGDSGSLLVDRTTPPHPVGLIFAGNSSGTFAVANRIDLVLGRFGVTIDDTQP